MRRYLFLALALLPSLAGAQINPNPADAITQKTFANLGTPPNGVINYCTDCSQTDPCTGAGAGAFAYRRAGSWSCAAASVSVGVSDPGADGFMVRTALNTSVARSATSPLGTLAIGNADGVAANPTLDVDTSIIGQFSSGAGTAPATCVQGDFYYETDTFFATACPATDNPVTLIGKAETSTSGFGFVIDEDSFATDSATKVPTQQSVKAYVDANAGGGGAFSPTAFTSDEEFLMDALPADNATTGLGWGWYSCTYYSQAGTQLADHPGKIDLGTNGSDNNPCFITTTPVIGTTYTGSEWTVDVLVLPNVTVADVLISLGLQAGAVDATTDAIRVKYDTDDSDATWIFQICNADSAAGCDAAGDDTNSKTVASTIAPAAGTWNRFRARRVESGVGGNPTIYMRMNDETEVTFCASGCDDTLATLPSGVLSPIVEITNRTTDGRYLSVDYYSLRITSGLVRY